MVVRDSPLAQTRRASQSAVPSTITRLRQDHELSAMICSTGDELQVQFIWLSAEELQ